MSIRLATNCRSLSATKVPGLPASHERLVEAIVEGVAPRKPESHLLKEIQPSEVGKISVWPLREQLDRMNQTHLALFRRTHKNPVITEKAVVGISLSNLPEDLGTQVRDMACDAELETLYTATKFAAAMEDRRTTHPILRDTQDPSGVSGDVAGLFAVTRDLTGKHDTTPVDRGQRAHTLAASAGTVSPSAAFQRESMRQQGVDRRREESLDRHSRPTNTRNGHRCIWRTCSLRHLNLQDRWAQPFSRLFRGEPQSSNALPPPPCFACGRTGHRLINCAKYLHECARDPLRANRCPACNAAGLCSADCRRRL